MTASETKSRGIMFSAEMVRAILDGRKTQTRRIIKPQPPGSQLHPHLDAHSLQWAWYAEDDHIRGPLLKCPYGKVFDHLWVREKFSATRVTRSKSRHQLLYAATLPAPLDTVREWKSARHMPRWASRLTLEITDIRVQRVQDISAEDCEAEGIVCESEQTAGFDEGLAFFNFISVWERINGKTRPWASNPWVWAITFRKAETA